jgi:poly(3-hydroxybutyrate) depolymerase
MSSRIQSFLSLAALVLVLAPFARAQEKEGKESLNQQAISALQAKKYDEGIALLTRILSIPGQEKDNGTAYNIACGYSLKADVEKGFEWLEKAVDWGWGDGTGTLVGESAPKSHVEMTKSDPDLENLRKDPRFEKLMERMAKTAEARAAKVKKGEEYAKTAAVYIPEKIASLPEMPVLVVLHDQGSTKDEVIKGKWKAVADELGFALIAPSGKILVGDDPEKGMAWFNDPKEYFEKPVHDAFSAFKKDHPIDKAKVVIAGDGLGGFAALKVGIGSPGYYKGVVSLNGGINADVMASKAPTAGKMGLRVRILLDEAAVKKMAAEGVKDADPAKIAAGWSQSLQTWGIGGDVKTFTAEKGDEQLKPLLVEAVKSVLPEKTAAAEAGAPK